MTVKLSSARASLICPKRPSQLSKEEKILLTGWLTERLWQRLQKRKSRTTIPSFLLFFNTLNIWTWMTKLNLTRSLTHTLPSLSIKPVLSLSPLPSLEASGKISQSLSKMKTFKMCGSLESLSSSEFGKSFDCNWISNVFRSELSQLAPVPQSSVSHALCTGFLYTCTWFSVEEIKKIECFCLLWIN